MREECYGLKTVVLLPHRMATEKTLESTWGYLLSYQRGLTEQQGGCGLKSRDLTCIDHDELTPYSYQYMIEMLYNCSPKYPGRNYKREYGE